MRLFFYILNKTEYLDEIISEFAKKGINGATVIEGTGMAKILSNKYDDDELPFLASLRNFLKPERESSSIIFTVINDDQLQKVVDIIERIVGDLSLTNNGIVFSFPIDYTKGIVTNGK